MDVFLVVRKAASKHVSVIVNTFFGQLQNETAMLFQVVKQKLGEC